MRKGKIIVISGPSGSGKTTLHKKLLLSRRFKGKLVKSVSATTRPARPGEKNGRDYLFLTKKQFLSKIRTDHFLEWERIFGHCYGTPKEAVERLLKGGKNVLLCIDVKGAKVVLSKYPNAVRIFISAPSHEVLKERLRKRGSETKGSLLRRLQIAQREMREAKRYNHVIINDNLKKALKKLECVICGELKKGEVDGIPAT
jgi:guanylate kinase